MVVEHSNYGKIMVLAIILSVPIAVILFLEPINDKELCKGDICITDIMEFSSECTDTTCIYNLDNSLMVIKIQEHALSWSIAGNCIQKIATTTNEATTCVDLFLFQKNTWSHEEILFEQKLFEIFIRL